jgi:uncharacterized protein YndB with AHSA1/START domain
MDSIIQTHHLPGQPAEVFEWLTNPERLVQWSGPDAQFEPRVGGNHSLFEDWVMGKVRVIEPPNVLEYTWEAAGWAAHSPESVVRFELTPSPQGGTNVQLTHTGFPNQQERDSHAEGWAEHVFGPIRNAMGSIVGPVG